MSTKTMKLMNQIVVIISIFLISSSAVKCAPNPESDTMWGFSEVSLVKLLARPEEFNGKWIAVSGALRTEYEGSRIYLTKEHANYAREASSIWVEYDTKNLTLQPKDIKTIDNANKKYVLLYGQFDAHSNCLKKVRHLNCLDSKIKYRSPSTEEKESAEEGWISFYTSPTQVLKRLNHYDKQWITVRGFLCTNEIKSEMYFIKENDSCELKLNENCISVDFDKKDVLFQPPGKLKTIRSADKKYVFLNGQFNAKNLCLEKTCRIYLIEEKKN